MLAVPSIREPNPISRYLIRHYEHRISSFVRRLDTVGIIVVALALCIFMFMSWLSQRESFSASPSGYFDGRLFNRTVQYPTWVIYIVILVHLQSSKSGTVRVLKNVNGADEMKIARKLLQISLVILSTIMLLSANSTTIEAKENQISVQCGRETSNIQVGEITLASFTGELNQVSPSEGAGLTLSQVDTATHSEYQIVERVTIANGRLQGALLQTPLASVRYDVKTLARLDANGQLLQSIETQTIDATYWFHLMPARSQDEVGVFGIDSDLNGQIVRFSLVNEQLVMNDIIALPFQFYFGDSWWYSLSISPDWTYISYGRRNEGEPRFEYFIYSIVDARFVWLEAMGVDDLPDITWLEDEANIAVVSRIGRDFGRQGELKLVSHSGETQVIADLGQLFGAGSVTVGDGVALPNNRIAFLASLAGQFTSRLLFLDTQTGQITDTCITGDLMSPIAIANGETVVVQTVNTETPELIFVSASTNDYSRVSIPVGYTVLPEPQSQGR
ncbi:MAG: hypothetical protein SF123_00065 [Chloroflexota bacterium]|nr:hypothetical protein [Chloroflexota bacterium]